MIVPLKPVDFKREKVTECFKNEVRFLKDRFEIIIDYWAEAENHNTHQITPLYCKENLSVKRKKLTGYVVKFDNHEEHWQVKIMISGCCDSHISFDTEAEARDFEELLRNYIYDDATCTT